MRTRVGYTGGQKSHPTYYSLGDHTEAFQVDFDPSQISFEDLLGIFWDSHNPTRRAWSTQYKAALWVHNEQQVELAEASKIAIAQEKTGKWFNRNIHTEILPAEAFYLAEDYHHKYLLQNTPRLWGDILEIYRENQMGWINSTAAARLNGYVGGYATMAQLEEEIESLGLSSTGQAELRKIVGRFGK